MSHYLQCLQYEKIRIHSDNNRLAGSIIILFEPTLSIFFGTRVKIEKLLNALSLDIPNTPMK